ncbi:MAG: amidohydrolase family protein, partial [Bacteroidota bacterium]
MNKGILLILVSLFALITACDSVHKVDLIVKNAKIYTLDNDFSVQEAFAVKDGKFIAIGSNKDICSKYEAAEVLDLNGKSVYPGFIDAHAHFFGYGLGIQTEAQLYETKSEQEILNILQSFQSEKQNPWIIGRGWDQNDWEKNEFPNKDGLDKLFPDTPVYLVRIDGHAAWVNSKALELAGITSTTQISGGEIVKQNGKPSGILIDNAMSLVRSLIPKSDKNAQIKALLAAQKNCFEVGLTGVTDAGLDLNQIKLIDSLQKSSMLKMRINAMISPTEENFNYFLEKGPYVTDYLSVRTIKLYADGALGSRGAALLKPYTDDLNNYGLMIKEENYYRDICKKALKYNYQVATHAIGDSA